MDVLNWKLFVMNDCALENIKEFCEVYAKIRKNEGSVNSPFSRSCRRDSPVD